MSGLPFLEEFRAEAAEHLRSMEASLLHLERAPGDGQALRQLFLSVHTIKGGAALVGLPNVRELAHAVEDVLSAVRDEHRRLDRPVADLLFVALDVIRDAVDRSSSAGGDVRVQEVTAALQGIVGATAVEPVAPDRAAGVPPDEGSHANAGVPAPAHRVLLVEDSATVRTLEAMLLADAGFDVEPVPDGERALEMARMAHYDLVVSGMETAGLRGMELAAALRQTPDYRSVPIILTTAGHPAEPRVDLGAMGTILLVEKSSSRQSPLANLARMLVEEGPR